MSFAFCYPKGARMTAENKPKPPEIGPYVFPVILAFFGVWCFYDGWLTTDPDMQEHLMFNRVAAGLLIPWAIIDFIRTRKKEQQRAEAEQRKQDNPSQSDSPADD